MNQLKLSINNCRQKTVGEHGLSEKELCSMDQRLLRAYQKLSEAAAEPKTLVKTSTAWRKSHLDKENIERTKQTALNILSCYEKGEIEDLVILGIGGSDLGAKALHEALNCAPYYNLRSSRKSPRIFFIGDNSCPEEIEGLLETVNPNKTLFNVISKSGTTPETLANYYILREKISEIIGKKTFNSNVIATTGENDKSELWLSGHYKKDEKLKEIFRDFLPVPEGVGGRFSVFSPVGLLYAFISGLNVDAIINGLKAAEERSELHPLNESNISYQFAKVLYLEDVLRGKNIISFFPFDNRLDGISRWFRQLWAESLGKKIVEQQVLGVRDRKILAKLYFSAGKLYKADCTSGISIEGDDIARLKILRKGKPITYKIREKCRVTGTTPLAWVGSRDNHSSWQLGNAGPKDKVVVFTRVQDYRRDYVIPVEKESKLYYLNGKFMGRDLCRACEMGTEEDAVKNGIPNLTFYLPVKDEYNIADYMYTLMMATAVAGELYEINAFDQPAVEGYKTFAKKIIMQEK